MSTPETKHNPFVICKAAAGSGKTFNLVKEYLKLAMAGGLEGIERRFAGILAITFTNKAAGEMKSRIMDYLDEMALHGADPGKSGMGAQLLAALNEERRVESGERRAEVTEAQLKEMAARLRSAILHRYSDLSVCTIDSFMHRIVRTFAHDLDQPVNFEVMIEKDDLIEQAVSGLMSLVGTEGHEDLTQVVQRFAISRMENERGFDIVGSLTTLAGQLFSEGTDPYLEQLSRYKLQDFMEMHRRYSADNRAYEQQVKALGQEAMSLLAEAGMGPDQCANGATGYYAFFRRMATLERLERPGKNTVKVFEADDYGGARLCKAKLHLPEADAIAPRLLQIYNGLLPLLGEPLTDYNTRTLLIDNLFAMALLRELNHQLHAIARDNEVVHLSEFNRLINKIVQEQPTPFIYERLGNRYRHFLIDEFQDTSVLQWQNLVPLLEGGVSQGKESLVVGDGKQAIYRFRQGDVRQFVDLPKVQGLRLHGASLSHPGNYSVQHLRVNYRTADAVVQFNNDFFSWLVRNRFSDNDLARRIYLGPDGDSAVGEEELRQELNLARADRPEGHVGISFVDPEEEEAVCARVLEIIEQLTGEGGYQPRDIMILGRTKRELALVGGYLLAHSDFEQSSAESFYLCNSQVALTLVAALRCLRDGADRVAAAELLHRLYGLGIAASRHDEAFLVSGGIDLQGVLTQEGIDFNAGYLLSMSLYDCCEELVRRLRLDGQEVPYLASLLNRAAAFSARHKQSLDEFLTWFDDRPDLSAASTEEGNALRLMTIHKAKGLEAPVVICPFFTPRSRPKGIWVDVATRFAPYDKSLPAAYVTLGKDTATRFDPDRDRERESAAVDDLNILYVAFTRPKEQLFVVCQEPKAGGEAQTYARMLADYVQERTDYGDPAFRHGNEGDREKGGEAWVRRLSFADWTEKVMIASPSEQAMTPLMEAKVRFGIHAHAALAQVTTAAAAEAAVARYAAREQLDDDVRQRIMELVNNVVTHPDTARFFDPAYGVKNECDLTDGVEAGRPDRLIFAPGETWVVDFKTGKDMPGLYDRQLSHYCRAVEAMGYPKVSGWLVFLQPTVTVRQVVRKDGELPPKNNV